MKLELNEDLFGPLWPYIINDNITDIKWNGSGLFIDDLTKGRYRATEEVKSINDQGNVVITKKPKELTKDFVNIFTSKIANMVNENFNISEPSLQAETDELRIQALHESVTGDGTTSIAIRKTPSVSRLASQNLVETGYLTTMVDKLLPCLIKARCSGIITGDVGAGKTELEKYLAQYIPEVDGIATVEDTLEMKLKALYPSKDIITIKTSDTYSNRQAIKDCLRLMIKWLIIAESRGDDIVTVMEAASTGCCALTTIHAENVWNIPDRIISMAGDKAKSGLENDVYNFFDFSIKIKANKDQGKITRSIDQLCFFDRTDKVNSTIVFIEDGKWTMEKIPPRLLKKFKENNETNFLSYYKAQLKLAEDFQKENKT